MDEALWLFNSILNNTWLIPEQERSLSRKDKKKLDYKGKERKRGRDEERCYVHCASKYSMMKTIHKICWFL